MKTSPPSQCLVFDPEHESQDLPGFLIALGLRVTVAPSAAAALRAAAATPHHVAFVSVRSRDPAGFGLISTLLSSCHALEVVALVRPSDLAAALEAGRRGARSCLPHAAPFADVDRLIDDRSRAFTPDDDQLVAGSPAMRMVTSAVLKAAGSDAPLLLRGERGSGREALARLAHARGARAAHRFEVVRCAELSARELTALLPARLDAARRGTVYLDEVGELPADVQRRLLRALDQDDAGSREAARVIASTSRELSGSPPTPFDAELLRRLSVIVLEVPPLRERPEDLLVLAEGMLGDLAGRAERRAPELDESARAALAGYDWPGNLPELRGELEHALAMTGGDLIHASALSSRLHSTSRALPHLGGDFTLEEIERAHIERVLARSRTFDGAAALLGIDDSTLWRKRKRYASGRARSRGDDHAA